MAAVNSNNILDGVLTSFRSESSSWESLITTYAQNLFWILATIELTWVGITLGLGRNELDNALGTIVRTVLVIGFFWVLVVNGFDWAGDIISSLRQIGQDAATASGAQTQLYPSAIVELGLIITGRIFSEIGVVSPSSWILLIPALIIMVCFAVIAAEMVLILVESYLVTVGGIIFLGFGASRFTNNFAVNYFKYALSVGVKLMLLQFLIAVAWGTLFQWRVDVELTEDQILTLAAASIVIAILISRLPGIAAAMINGSAFGGGLTPNSAASAFMGSVTGAATGSVSAAKNATGGAMAVAEAAKLANANGATGVSTVTQAASHIMNHGMSDIGGKLAGNPQNQHGTSGGRIADSMKSERLSIIDSGNSISAGNSEYISPASNN
jgi:type IV secretion system protein TrbL